MKKIFSLCVLMLLVIGANAQKLQPDGPYILYNPYGGYRYIAVDTMGNIIDKCYDKMPKKLKIQVFSSDKKHNFEVEVNKQRNKTATELSHNGKTVVITDPHADFTSFFTTLHNNSVIDKNMNWVFGKNQLVIIGDIFDRGDDATTILWAVYKLEQQALKKGGKVIYMIGNHEDMVLRGDDRYINKKYSTLADTLGIVHKQLYAKQTEFGEWIRTKNIIQKINNHVFLHAGLGEEFLQRDLSFDFVNSTVYQWLGASKEDYKKVGGDIEFIYRTYGPIWYRGMVYPDKEKYRPIGTDTADKLLKKYSAKKFILGHTIFEDITLKLGGRVITSNVRNYKNREAGRGMGLLIEGDKIWVIYTEKQPVELKF